MTKEMMEEILDNWIVWTNDIHECNRSTWSQRDNAIVKAITNILERELEKYEA
tara:strand:- start:3139 stop:3297 length:159 start_codon:yes stop_codon:yes gene_type:complete